MPDAIGKSRLLQLAEFIRQIPSKHFNFSHVVKTDKDALHLTQTFEKIWQTQKTDIYCNSAACAIGWMPIAFPVFCKYDFDYEMGVLSVFLKDPDNFNLIPCAKYSCESFKTAQKFFRLTEEEADYLFLPETYPDHHETTKEQVAQRIENFCRNGMPENGPKYSGFCP